MTNAPDPRLEALLRDLPAPPPVPAGLADRILAAAAAAPQEPRPARAQRAARRDRRGRWLRRPLLAGTAALGLLVTSAVAATLAGVPIPQKIAAVFFPQEAPAPKEEAAPRRAARPAAAPEAPVRSAEAKVEGEDVPPWFRNGGPWRRLMRAQRMVDARRAMGLPTPGADRIERQLNRRTRMWQDATPEQRAQWLEQRRARREARQTMLATPEGREALAARREQIRVWRAQQRAGIPLTREERAERRDLIRQWRAQEQAMQPAPEQRAARQERFRHWREAREARRGRWQGQGGQADDNTLQAGSQGPETRDR